MTTSRAAVRVLSTVGAGILAAAVAVGPAAASPGGGTPVPPGSPGDTNGNGLLDSSETPDNPDAPPLGTQVPPGSPGDDNGNGQLDSSETPDNPDVP